MKYIIIATTGIIVFIIDLFGPEMKIPANSVLWWIEGFIGEIGLYTSIVAISLFFAVKYRKKREKKYKILFLALILVCSAFSTFLLTFGVNNLNNLEMTLLNGEMKILTMDVSQKSTEFQRAFSKIYATAYYTVHGEKIDYQDSTGKTIQLEPTISNNKQRELYAGIPALFDLKRIRMRIAGINYAILIFVVTFIFWKTTEQAKPEKQ